MTRAFMASDGLAATGIDRDWLAGVLPLIDPSRVQVREAPRWFRALWAKGIVAVAMPWAIYFTPSMMDLYDLGAEGRRLGQLLVHELTHIEQLKRLGIWRHVRQYLGDYISGRRQGKDHWDAYRSIRLEVEAREVADLVETDGPR